MKKKFIDLGLPSERLWANVNEPDYYTFDEAVKKFGAQLPKGSAWMELLEECSWKWDDEKKGYIVTGPNGNSIFIPAMGYRVVTGLYGVGSDGDYWSSTANDSSNAYGSYFDSDGIDVGGCNRHVGYSVRLTKEKA